MVWGQKQGVDDLAQRLAANDPKLMSLTVMRFRQFGHEVSSGWLHAQMFR